MANVVGDFLLQGESMTLDFKRASSWDPKNDRAGCCGLAKDILAFANTNGGHILIGVDEIATGLKPTGLTFDQMKTWDSTKVNQFLASYVDPPINTTILKPSYKGMDFVVIEIPPFPTSVHICTTPYQGALRAPAIYVRTSNNASAEVSNTIELNHIIERSIRNRSNQMLTQFRSILVGATISGGPSDLELFEGQLRDAESAFSDRFPSEADPRIGFVQYAAWPSTFSAQRFDVPELRRAANKANVDPGGWINPLWQGITESPIAIQDGIESWLEMSQPYWYQYWRLQQSGFLFHRQTILDDVDTEPRYLNYQPGEIIALDRLMAIIAMSVMNLVNIYESLAVIDEEITMRFQVINTKGRRAKVPSSCVKAWMILSAIVSIGGSKWGLK